MDINEDNWKLMAKCQIDENNDNWLMNIDADT